VFSNRSYGSAAIYVIRYSKRTQTGVMHLAVTYVNKNSHFIGYIRNSDLAGYDGVQKSWEDS
jgi:hypothetical protein